MRDGADRPVVGDIGTALDLPVAVSQSTMGLINLLLAHVNDSRMRNGYAGTYLG